MNMEKGQSLITAAQLDKALTNRSASPFKFSSGMNKLRLIKRQHLQDDALSTIFNTVKWICAAR
jgi:hypothetical protein